MGVGVRPEAYPGTRVSAAYGYMHVPGEECSLVPVPRGPPSSPDLGVPTSPAPGVGVSWKLGPKRAGRVYRLACVRFDTVFSPVPRAKHTQSPTRAHACHRALPVSVQGLLHPRDRMEGIFATVPDGVRLALHPGYWS